MCPVCRLLLHLVGILFPHINDDARSKSLQTLSGVMSLFVKSCSLTFENSVHYSSCV